MNRSTLGGAWKLTAASFAVLFCFSATDALAVSYITTFGIHNAFVEPTGWDVGDADSTYQEWNWKNALTNNAPDAVNPRGLSFSGSSYFSPGSPTHSATGQFANFPMGVLDGMLLSSSHNFYAINLNLENPPAVGAAANIYNYGVGGPGEGTNVIVQTGSSLNGPNGNVPGTLRLVDISTGLPILGGANADATITTLSLEHGLTVTIPDGPTQTVDYTELKYNFFLPNYFGNFRVEWEQAYSTTLDTLRVDTFIGAQVLEATAAPEPASAVVWMLMLGTAGLIRRSRTARSIWV